MTSRPSGLDQLYQQVILDHYREKHGHGLRDAAGTDGAGAWAQSRQYNPLCGDEVTLRVVLDRSGDAVRKAQQFFGVAPDVTSQTGAS